MCFRERERENILVRETNREREKERLRETSACEKGPWWWEIARPAGKMVDGGAHVKENEEKDDGDLGEVWRLLYMHITFFFFFFLFFFIYAKGHLCPLLKECKNQFCP